MEAAGEPRVIEGGDLLWVANDERGRELEIIAIPGDDEIIVKHVMPTALRRRTKW